MLLVPEEAGRNRNRRIDRIFQYDSKFSYTIASTNLIRFPYVHLSAQILF